jgi:hypothetical protein
MRELQPSNFACIIKSAIKMKSKFIKSLKTLMLVLALGFLGQQAFCQQKIAANHPNPSSGALTNANAGTNADPVIKDTVECMFHQVVSNSRPLLAWRKGYIILENKQIRLGDQLYPTVQASNLTGLIQNQFLASNRKKPVTKKVVQVVILQ